MYDLIGDIHGHGDELVQLLEKLGYRNGQGAYRHPDRKAIFLGDFIDRGPQIRQVLQIVRAMIEAESALAVMGNHELNALAYHTEDPQCPGEFLRPHDAKNEAQHHATLEQFKNEPRELAAYLDWFRTLPMWLDLDGLRVAHACWDQRCVNQIAEGLKMHGGVTNAFLQSACIEEKPLFAPVEVILKGKETPLPQGYRFLDEQGIPRTKIRTRWYLSPEGQTYRTYALQSDPIPCDVALPQSVIDEAVPYPSAAKPVFVGHYWLPAKRPEILAENVACLDYSVAKNGFLCAYCWNSEQKLTNESFAWVVGSRSGSPAIV